MDKVRAHPLDPEESSPAVNVAEELVAFEHKPALRGRAIFGRGPNLLREALDLTPSFVPYLPTVRKHL